MEKNVHAGVRLVSFVSFFWSRGAGVVCAEWRLGGSLVELCASGAESGVDRFISVPIKIEVSSGFIRTYGDGDISVK